MDIEEKFGSDRGKIVEGIRSREERIRWYDEHPWEWQGSFKEGKVYRSLHHNMESLKARLEELGGESSVGKSE